MDVKKVVPVGKARTPQYPQQREVKSNPKLLMHIPARWQVCRGAVATAGLLATVYLSGCYSSGSPPMPSMLSEADAMRIITDTAKEYGLELALEVKRSELPGDIDFFMPDSQAEIGYLRCTIQGEQLDAYDADKKVGFEYVADQSGGDTSKDMTDISPDDADEQNERGEAAVLLLSPAYDSEQLKLQISSFLDWLKTAGVI